MNYDDFDPSQHTAPSDDRGDFEPVPDGLYDAVLVTCEGKDTSTGAHRINIRWDITGPTHPGRVVWDSQGWSPPQGAQPNQVEAAKKGQARIAQLCNFHGLKAFHPRSLVGLRCQIRVGTQAASNGYPAKNRVYAYKELGTGPVNPPAAPKGGDDDLPF